MKSKILLLIVCSHVFCFGQQSEMCLEYDSLQIVKSDTTQFIINALCKSDMESSATFTYKRQNQKNIREGKYTIRFKNNIVEEGTYRDGKNIDFLITYYPNQKVKEFIQILNDSVRTESTYYQSGGIESIGSTVNGKKDGIWKYYYESGFLHEIGQYSVVNITRENFKAISKQLNESVIFGSVISLREGVWKNYKTNGVLENSEVYKLGVIVR